MPRRASKPVLHARDHEHGGPDLLLWTVSGVRPMSEVLPDAFGPEDLGTTRETSG